MRNPIKNILIFSFIGLLSIHQSLFSQTGINTTSPSPNSVLDVASSTKGVLIPRLADSDVASLAANNPEEGMIVYNTSQECIQIYINGSFKCLLTSSQADATKDAWIDDPTNTSVKVGSTSTGSPRSPSTEVVIKDSGNVGVGTSTPQKNLHVVGGTQLSGELNVGGNANTAGSPGTSNQVLTSNGANAAPEWKSLSVVSGTISAAIYVQGTTPATVNQGSTVNVPGVTYTYTVPAGKTQTLLFTIVGYSGSTYSDSRNSGQGVFSLLQTRNGVTTKISSAYASVSDNNNLINVPVPATILKSVTLNSGTYTFRVQYKAWVKNQVVNRDASAFDGFDGDTESMLTKMQILVYNN